MGFNRYIIVKKRILGITCNTPTTLLVNDMLGGWGKRVEENFKQWLYHDKEKMEINSNIFNW